MRPDDLPAPTPLPEFQALQHILSLGSDALEVRELHRVVLPQGLAFPVQAITLGNPDPALPAIGFFGGVHGLERIGAEVVIAYLHSLVMRLRWDQSLQRQLEHVRLVFMPLVNPGGMWLGTRANPQGVDLMRNAPVQAQDPVPFLVGGQRWSCRLPWYRGRAGEPMEPENLALSRLVAEELFGRPFSLVLDCHSGFGMQDRLWFPWAHTRQPIAHLAEMQALKTIFQQSANHQPYVVEPQSRQYLTHGDIWDHLYRQSCTHFEGVFLPLTLEMGSWLWVKKNPRQLFSRRGIFNPLIEHRQQRVLRRHQSLLDFLVRATLSHAQWRPTGAQHAAYRAQALADWYPGLRPHSANVAP